MTRVKDQDAHEIHVEQLTSVSGIDRNRTWLKLYRSTLDSRIWTRERFTHGQAWVDLLMLAAFSEHTTVIRGNEITLKSGYVVGSHGFLAKRWKWNPRTVKKYLDWLSNESMISYKSTPVTTLISITNWNTYQQSAEQTTEQSAEQTTEQTTDQSAEPVQSRVQNRVQTHNKDKKVKNGKNVKNVKKEKNKSITPAITVCAETIATITNGRVDALELDRAFCSGYLQRTDNPLDVVIMELKRYDVWEDILSQFSIDVALRALDGFFATEDLWFSGRSGAVTLPFTPALFKTWLRQNRHLRTPGNSVVVESPFQSHPAEDQEQALLEAEATVKAYVERVRARQ